MLRSIFSLIQRIIDSDKRYNNTKSQAVIYCFTNPDNTVNMNVEIDGQHRQTVKAIERNLENDKLERSFAIKTEQGDTVICKHDSAVNIVPKGSKDLEKERQRVTFSNTEEKRECDETSGDVDPEVRANVKDLLENFPKKRIEISEKEKDQISSLLEQINKMKTGLERLQEIARQFNCSDRFNEDVNFLVNNVRPSLQKDKDSKGKNVSTKS